MKRITEEMLDELRAEVGRGMSEKRYRHTLAVERMTERLCALFCPEDTMRMRAAALLHDVTKERSAEEQIAIAERYGLGLTDADLAAPKTLHARTGAAIISDAFPAFDDPMIVSAIRWHTTGRADMSITEKLLYLADYIDDSRTFEGCVALRRHFWDTDPVSCDVAERLRRLRETLILSYEMTIADLLERGKTVATDTIEARDFLLMERKRDSEA